MDNRMRFPYLNVVHKRCTLYAVGCASTVAVKGPQHCFTTVIALLCPYYVKRLSPNFVSLTGCFAKLRLYFEVSCATLIYEQHLTSKINHMMSN
ncbi:unnamed protein product [Cylicocyclus nassatus]|uniref:Uncharacterized protein n=1 Tax=Cylicocyclus nassatus TaxID=53992 RepID=A0AA36GJR2_CYLNA|nr:unnamed protein product [Cylicocyclus nassatus]